MSEPYGAATSRACSFIEQPTAHVEVLMPILVSVRTRAYSHVTARLADYDNKSKTNNTSNRNNTSSGSTAPHGDGVIAQEPPIPTAAAQV